ncbi:MAG: response regulator [Lachnospiraceae bacterium]|nr:response regulator [Lachnospiraceae bacterium]
MYTVFIADDELLIRQGLKKIINWKALGFNIIGEASNGLEAFENIIKKQPDLVLLDVRMPKMIGTEIVKQAREAGFKGKVIILSGFTDFKYTQTAIQYGVDYYLAKPIDEDELLDAVTNIAKQFSVENQKSETLITYRQRAKGSIIFDLLMNKADYDKIDTEDIGITADKYQVVIYEQYGTGKTGMTYKFSDLLKVTNSQKNTYETIQIDQHDILILKDDFIIGKFNEFLDHYNRKLKPQKHSPLDTLFIAYGRVVDSIKDIHISYEEASRLLIRRFFCEKNQHTVGYADLPLVDEENPFIISPELLENCCEEYLNLLQTGKKNQLDETLDNLKKKLYNSPDDIARIKLFLTDLYLSVKEKIFHLYNNTDIAFMSNADIIQFITNKNYLYEIIDFLKEQFNLIISSIGNSSSDSVIDNIMHYIKHNYMNDIKLESLAPMFGYNSSYLGKIFNKKVGIGFNIFVDQVRIDKSKELLENSSLKVYEIAEKVGYHNVDYFHTKFKKYVAMSPAEYRKSKKKQ